MMDEILRSNYPVDEWSKVMTALGQNPGCSELFDMDIALMPINEHLNGDHVELGIENQESSWQPHGSRKFMKTKEPARPLETKTMKPDQAEKPIEKTVLLQPADVIEEVRTQPDEVCQGDVPVPIAHRIDQPVEPITRSAEPEVGQGGQQDCQNDGQNSVVDFDSASVSASASGQTCTGAEEFGMLTGKDKQMLDQWAPLVYRMPTFFGLLVQIGRLGSDDTCHEPVTTERLLSLSTYEPFEIRCEAFRLLKSAWDLGLLTRGGDMGKNNGAGSVWSFTADGKQYLINGLRTRLKMLNLSALSKEHICAQLCDDELLEWQLELRERNRLIEQSQAPKAPSDGSCRSPRRRLPSKFTGEPGVTRAVSRAELAKALHEQAMKHVRTNAPEVGTLWAGLVR
jgi:hypothetical protein